MRYAHAVLYQGAVDAAGGRSFMVAEADWDESAALVVVTVTLCTLATVEGAVYRPPAAIVPVPAGLSDQVQ